MNIQRLRRSILGLAYIERHMGEGHFDIARVEGFLDAPPKLPSNDPLTDRECFDANDDFHGRIPEIVHTDNLQVL